MRLEIERKFLVADGRWREAVTGNRELRDGLVSRTSRGKVRVRLCEDNAWLTVKGPQAPAGRREFEYEIPRTDAELLLAEHCEGPVIERIRYRVPHEGLTWEVDVYKGFLAGLVLAEVELESDEDILFLPDWIGRDVTGDPRFSQSQLLRLAELPEPRMLGHHSDMFEV